MMTEEEKRQYHVEAVRLWRKKHPEKVAEYMRKYRARHSDKVKEINEKTKKRRHAAKPKFDRSAYMKEYWRKKRGKKALVLVPMYREPETVGEVGKKPEGMPELFDRDKNWKELAQYEQTAQEKDDNRQYESYQKRLELLEQEYDDRKIDLEFYIRERSIILQKMKKYDKKTRENKSPFANEHYSI